MRNKGIICNNQQIYLKFSKYKSLEPSNELSLAKEKNFMLQLLQEWPLNTGL